MNVVCKRTRVLRMQHYLGTDPSIISDRHLKDLKAHVQVTLDKLE